MKDAADRLAEIQAMHARVHAECDRTDLDPLYRVYLDGAEMMIDWLLGTCPNGTFGEGYSPLTANCRWALVLTHDAAGARENGDYPFTAEGFQP